MTEIRTHGATGQALTMRASIFAVVSVSLLAFALPASAQNQDDRYRNDAESQYRYRDTSQADVSVVR